MNPRIACKLPFERAREGRVELKEKQMRILCHPPRDPARMHAFARAVLRDHARTAKVHFAGDAFHQRLRAGNDRRDLKRALEEALEKQGTHGEATVVSAAQV